MSARNDPKRVTLHCSATPDYKKDDPLFDRYGAGIIHQWHTTRGWNGIGYHRVIRRTGVIERGRDDLVIGAGVKGHNRDTIHICLIGTRDFTMEQVQSLIKLAHEYKQNYMITDWFGHYEFNERKTCPGVSMNFVRALLAL